MEMSNVERIRSFSAAFEVAVQHQRFGTPPQEKWDDIPYALEVAQGMKAFGEAIAHNSELYYGSFLNHARNCADKVADVNDAAPVRAVLQSIPGLVLAR